MFSQYTTVFSSEKVYNIYEKYCNSFAVLLISMRIAVPAKGYNEPMKRIIIVLTILYALSPLDLVPGPLDDIIVIVLGVAFSSVVGNEKRNV